MKWVTTISVLVALAAVAVLGAVLMIGVALPPKIEDMTVDDGNIPEVRNANLHLSIDNQTHREINVWAVLDGSLGFGASMIRDEHYGGCGIGTRVEPGTHSVEVMVSGRAPMTNTITFTTTPAMTNFISITISGDKRTGYKFKMNQSNKPRGII